ncbi:hypothetical protein GC169_03560 [bacterium]|nr:hypothetical protein [bacterium]
MALVVRITSYVLAAFMAFMGVQKFIGDVPIFAIIEANMASQWGLDLAFIDPWFKYLTGVLEIAAALILVIGQRFIGGALSTLVIAGAVGAHLTVLGVNTPMTSAPDAETSPMLFIMALVSFAVAAFVTVTSRPKA